MVCTEYSTTRGRIVTSTGKRYPDDFVFEPAEFDLTGPERAELRIRWRTK